ncbi:MAG: nuclear transport factor 2 family protein [Thermoguttaceae bacterium]
MGKSNIDIMRRGYDLFAKGDFARLPFDPQIEWIEPDVEGLPHSGTHHGSEAVINEIFEPTFDKLDDFHLECDQFLDAGDHVVVTGRFLGRGKDTGNDLNATFVHVWTLRNGKAVRFQNYTDTANWLRALYRVHLEQPVGAHR